MTRRSKSRSRLSLRRRGRAGEGFLLRARRRNARRVLREIETRRLWCGLNLFWADCGAGCRRAHACLAADPRACFAHRWDPLEEKDKAFRRDFMRAFARLRDRDEAMVEAIALALLRGKSESAASGAASPCETRELRSRSPG